MKKLEFVELKAQELEDVNGGIWPVVVAFGLTLLFDAILSEQESVDALKGGYNKTNRY